MYAVFDKETGRQISKEYVLREQALIHCYEINAVVSGSFFTWLMDIEIREI